MILRRVCSDISGRIASFWYLVSFPITGVGFLIALVMRKIRSSFLAWPLVQWMFCPRLGTNLFSRIGRILFTSQSVHSLLGGSLAGLAFLMIYFNITVSRFDGTYYVQFGEGDQAYAQEATVLPTEVAVEPAIVVTPSPAGLSQSIAKDEETVTSPNNAVHGEIRAGYVAPEIAYVTPVQFTGSFVTPLRNPPRLLLTTRYSGGHPGVDLSTELGTPLFAVADGIVISTGTSIWAYGRLVTIDHGDGWQSMYAHMSRIDVKSGDYVTQASVIGAVGSTGNSTGPHVHFELHRNGVAVNPKGLVAGI